MDSDSWANGLFLGSRRHHSRSDPYYGEGDDMDSEDESRPEFMRPEFMCPFCTEEFDVVGLFCHIDEEHVLEAKNGICPVCAKKVGMDLVGHITMQHGSLLKVQRKRRLRKGGSTFAFSLSRKELREGSLQSFNAEPDPLLSSFMSNIPTVDEPVKEKAISSVETSLVKEVSPSELFKRNVQRSPLSVKDQEEGSRKSEFIQGLLLSTFMDEDL